MNKIFNKRMFFLDLNILGVSMGCGGNKLSCYPKDAASIDHHGTLMDRMHWTTQDTSGQDTIIGIHWTPQAP